MFPSEKSAVFYPLVRPIAAHTPPHRHCEFALPRAERRPRSPSPPSISNSVDEGSEIDEEEGENGENNLQMLAHAIHNPINVLLKRDWTEEYLQCPKWGGDWLVAVSEKVEEWPPGIEVFGGRMFLSHAFVCPPLSQPK